MVFHGSESLSFGLYILFSMSSLGVSLRDKRTSFHVVSNPQSNARKIREFHDRFVGTRNADMLVDHVGGLSSSKKSMVFQGFLLFQVDFLPEVSSSSGFSAAPFRPGRPASRSWDTVSLSSSETFSSR